MWGSGGKHICLEYLTQILNVHLPLAVSLCAVQNFIADDRSLKYVFLVNRQVNPTISVYFDL